MAVKVIREEREGDLMRVEDANANWVTLTKHPVNSQGFRIVKSDDEETKYLQAVLVPADQADALDALADEIGASWLHDLKKSDTKARGAFVEFVQSPRSDFLDDSLTFEAVGNSRAIAVVGQRKADLDVNPETVSVSVPMRMDSIPIAAEATPPITWTFSDLLCQELDSFLGIVAGAVKQSNLTSADRKKMVMGAHKALGQFLSAGLDKLNEVVAGKMEKADFSGQIEKLQKAIADSRAALPADIPAATAQNQEGDNMTHEEITAVVTAAVSAVLQKFDKDGAAPPVEGPTPPAASDHAEDKLVALEAALKALGASVSSLMEKADQLSNTLAAEPQGESQSEGAALKKADPEELAKVQQYLNHGVPKEDRAGVFNGTLFNWQGFDEQVKKLLGEAGETLQ